MNHNKKIRRKEEYTVKVNSVAVNKLLFYVNIIQLIDINKVK